MATPASTSLSCKNASSSPSSPTVAIFSDEISELTTTPPSSPPPPTLPTSSHLKPWQTTTPQNAFSILGKRKALSPISQNTLPPPRPSKKRKSELPTQQHSQATNKPLTQLHLSLGQTPQHRCGTCTMTYTLSSAEDRLIHSRYHAVKTLGQDVGASFVAKIRSKSPETVYDVGGIRPGDAIVRVERTASAARRKRAREVLEAVREELGAVEVGEGELWGLAAEGKDQGSYCVFLYVREGRAVGCLLAKRISRARRVEEPKGLSLVQQETAVTGGALEALKRRREALVEAAKAPIRLSTKEAPARLGISRIWTLAAVRRQGVAARLLDVAIDYAKCWTSVDEEDGSGEVEVETKKERREVDGKEMVAFSQPTEAGMKLARRWFGKVWGWSVYVE